jgi:uncharacterized protein (DUF924 family)
MAAPRLGGSPVRADIDAMSIEPALYAEIVAFWRDAGPKAWFAKNEAFDDAIRAGFEAAHLAASRGEYADWAETAEGALALVLLLDQFPRNLYRDSGHAFATDGLARAVAEKAVAAGHDQAMPMPLRIFFYLPFEHAEDMAAQERGVALMTAAGDEEYTRYARLHRDIIGRFTRFPHRNAVLGRASTAEEAAFLKEGGFKG